MNSDNPETPAAAESALPRLPSLLNRAHVRRMVLDLARRTRPKFTRVGGAFLDRIEARVRDIVHDELRRHPSTGKTLK